MKYIILLIAVLPVITFAQKNINFENSNDLIRQGVDYHDLEKYADAIELYDKVPINDTNYALAQYEIGLSYIGDEEYKKAQEILSDLLTFKIAYSFKHLVYMQLGNAYDLDKQPEKAIEIYTEGLKSMPYQHNLLYNRGVCYELMGKYKEAVADYQAAILGNIYHAQSHGRLGVLCARMGLYDQATLSLMTAIWLDPTSSNAGIFVANLESIADGSYEEKPVEQIIYENSDEDPYADYNEFFLNKTALQPNYKVKLTVATNYARQFDLFLKNNKYVEGNLDFWNLTYMKFYENIYQTKKYDLLILLSIAGVDNSAIQAKVNAKLSKIKAFYDVSKTSFFDLSESRYMEYEGKKQFVEVDYTGSRFNSVGLATIDPNTGKKSAKGNYYYYHPNGMLKMVAHVDEAGKPIGKWQIYNDFDGIMEREIEFLDPTSKINYEFYDSGELYTKYKIVNDLAEGTVETYYRNGTLREKYDMKAAVKNGAYTSYYPNGAVQQTVNYVDGLADGSVKSYHENGALKDEFGLVKGLVQGKRTKYYPNKKVQSEYNYVDDKYDGGFKTYYATGQLEEEGAYKKGIQVGESKEYYSNGALRNTLTLDESGKQTGASVNYDIDGKKYQQFDFTKGILTKISYISKDGTVKELSEVKNKKLDYYRSFPNGKVNVKGQLVNDLNEGKWEYFDQYDNLWKVENYKEGELVDTLIVYHSNGKVKAAYQIADGEQNGLYLGYNIFGDLVTEGIYKDGIQDKEWYRYFTDGTISAQSYFVEGDRHGYQVDYDVTGKIFTIEQYDNGKLIFNRFLDTLENILVEYGEFNGEVKIPALNKSYTRFVGNYVNGNNDGLLTHYSSDGVISQQGNFVNDFEEGPYKWYFDDGKIMHERAFLNGEQNGLDVYYFENGNKSAVYNFVEGEMQGEFIDYHENGKENFKGVCIDDERHGRVTTFGQKGEVAMYRYYDQGTIVSYSYLGTDGKEITPISLVGNEMNIVCYFRNGKKSMEHKRVNGLIEGPYLVYHENGQKAEEGNYQYGEENGKTTTWNDAGVKLSEKDYTKGYADGWEINYYPNGKVASKIPYRQGYRHGTATYYSADGKLTKSITYYYNESLEIKKM